MWLHLFGLSFLSSFQLCQVINSKFDIFGVNVDFLGFIALNLTAFSKSKSLFFFNLKQNLLSICVSLGRTKQNMELSKKQFMLISFIVILSSLGIEST